MKNFKDMKCVDWTVVGGVYHYIWRLKTKNEMDEFNYPLDLKVVSIPMDKHFKKLFKKYE